ncbi:MAG: hypothetical protein AAF614_24570 [Chloroflexota bacterium]
MRDEIEVMRVLRLPPMGKLAVEAKNQRYDTLADVPDKKMQQLIKTAVGELVAFAGGYQTLVDAGVAPPLAANPTTPSEAAAVPASNSDIRPVARETAVSAAPPANSLNIVDGINSILEQKLTADPALKERTVKLINNPGGGLQINVDGTYYQQLEKIEEQNIQNLIRQALKEWENS